MQNKPRIKKSSMRKMNTKEKLVIYFKMRDRLEYLKELKQSEQMNRSVK